MNIEQLSEFFKWMTIINIGLLLFSTFATVVLKSLMVNIHTRMFDVSETQMSVAIYAYLGMFKVLIIVFNIVPYCALLMINQ